MPNLRRRRSTGKIRAARKNPRFTQAVPSSVLPENACTVYERKIKGFMDGIHHFGIACKKNYGSSPKLNQLQKAVSGVNKNLRKKNIITPQLMTSLSRVQRSLGGISKAPKSFRASFQNLYRYLRENVRKDVSRFLSGCQKILTPMHQQLSSLETQLKRQIAQAKHSKSALKADPAIMRQLNSLKTQIKNFQGKWYPRFTKISTHGSHDIERQVKNLKAQISELQKLVNSNISLVKKGKRFKSSKSRTNTRTFITKAEVNKQGNQWQKTQKQFENYRVPTERYVEQLRAVKTS